MVVPNTKSANTEVRLIIRGFLPALRRTNPISGSSAPGWWLIHRQSQVLGMAHAVRGTKDAAGSLSSRDPLHSREHQYQYRRHKHGNPSEGKTAIQSARLLADITDNIRPRKTSKVPH